MSERSQQETASETATSGTHEVDAPPAKTMTDAATSALGGRPLQRKLAMRLQRRAATIQRKETEAPKPDTAPTTAPAATTELSGVAWVAKFPQSSSLDDLKDPFQTNCKAFVKAMRDGGANVDIKSTYRPDERAWLMHYCGLIGAGTIKADKVPAKAGVDINWVHATDAESVAAAKEMMKGYHIAYPAAYPSNHTPKRAVDMWITWSGTLSITQPDGTKVDITSDPRTGEANTDLHKVGKAFSVIKLLADKPHWSENGH